MLALRRDDEHAARTGREKIAFRVDLQSVRKPLSVFVIAVESNRTREAPNVPSGFTSNTRQIAAVESD